MADKFVNKRDVKFLLDEVSFVKSLLKGFWYADDGLEKNVGAK